MIRTATIIRPIIASMPKLIPMVCSIPYASDGWDLSYFGENNIFFVRTRRLFDYDFFEWAFWHVVCAFGVSVVFYVAVRAEGFEDYFFFRLAQGQYE